MVSDGGTARDLKRATLEKILASPAFAAAPRDQSFLRFVAEETLAGHGAELKETVIASGVFGRKADFDPRLDAIVRVVANHVRKRLAQYYATDGAGDPMIIEIPKGRYEPVFRAREAPPAAPSPAPSGRRWLSVAAGLGVMACGLLGFLLYRGCFRPAPHSLVVLPFANLDGAKESDYLAGAISEDLTTELARSASLRVVARTTALQFQKQGGDVRAIGRKLGVQALVEGGVRRTGGAVKITAQLIDVASGYHLWSASFEGPQTRLLDFQDQIAGSVRQALGASAQPPAARPSGDIPTEAQEAYWEARYLLRCGSDGRAAAVPFLEQAVKLYPNYAKAYAALATAYSTMAFHAEGPPAELAAKARQAAGRALALDRSSAESYVALAVLAYSRDHDWRLADSLFHEALRASPNYARAHTAYGLALMSRGRSDQAIEHMRTARDLDPLSSLAGNDLAVVLWSAHRWSESLDASRRTLEVQPDFAPAYLVRGACLTAQGDFRGADAAFEQAARRLGRISTLLGLWGYSRARAGDRASALAMLQELGASPEQFPRAVVAAGLGDRALALDYLERAFARQETDIVFLAAHPCLDSLRGEPRFRALLGRLGL